MKKGCWFCLLALVLLFGCGVVYADGEFYVIPAGKKAKRTILVSPKSDAAASGAALSIPLMRILL